MAALSQQQPPNVGICLMLTQRFVLIEDLYSLLFSLKFDLRRYGSLLRYT